MPPSRLRRLWALAQAVAGFWQARPRLRLAVNVGLGAALLAFIAWYFWNDVRQVLAEDITLSQPHLAGAVLLYGVNFAVFIIVWRGIVARLGGPAGWRYNALRYANTSLMRFLPTPAWFLASRVQGYVQPGLGRRAALAMTALETLLHLWTGVVFYGVLAFDPQQPLTWLYLLLLVPVVAVLVRPHWLNLSWMTGGTVVPGVRRQDVVLWLSLFTLTWVLAGPFFRWTIQAFTTIAPLPLPDLWRIWALSSVVAYISSYTFGGLGFLREFALTWLLARFYPTPVALLMALVVRLVLTGGGVAWGVGLAGGLMLLGRGDAPPPLEPVDIKEQA